MKALNLITAFFLIQLAAFSQNYTRVQPTMSIVGEKENEQLAREMYRRQITTDAAKKGMPQQDVKGYVQAKMLEYEAHNNTHSSTVAPNPSAAYRPIGGGSHIYSAGCPNAGFENGNFANWTGSYGTSSSGPPAATQPNYNITSATILSSAGPNAGLQNATNYHTIMNTPPTNNQYPNCNQTGYDSIAVMASGSQTLSQIPFVCPFFGSPNSVRMNAALANYRACSLKYQFSIGPANKNVQYAFALVIYDGGHAAYDQPYFQVKVTDQNGNPIGGNCGVYNINATMATTDTSFASSALSTGIYNAFYYRKWRQYGIDLSSPIYASVTQVNLEFLVGGCAQGGHFAYAYVDAACSQGGIINAMCAGTNSAIISAPNGYVGYQWFGPNTSTVYPSALGGNTQSITVNPAIVGQTFTVNMVTATGCTVQMTNTLAISQVTIVSLNSLPTCPGGNSGSAVVNVAGSNSGYLYNWQNSSGTSVSTASNAVNLAPGIYSITVTGISCGSVTQTVQVGISPPYYASLPAPYCGTKAIISNPGNTNYQWYNNMVLIPAPAGTTSSIIINSPINNSVYYLTFTTPQGCKDSLKYTLQSTPPGAIGVASISPICPAASNGSAAVILTPAAGAPLGQNTYSVNGPGAYSSSLAPTSNYTYIVNGLSAGVYTVNAFDGSCFYVQQFTVTPYTFNYTVSPLTATVCQGNNATYSVVMGNPIMGTPCTNLGVGPACTTPNQVTLGTATTFNQLWSYPSPYALWWNDCHQQFLYTASELLTMGAQQGYLTSMAFNVQNLNGIGNLPNYTIKIKCTNNSAITAFDYSNTFYTVYTSPSYNPIMGWNVHNFATPYYWDGVSNILVDICFNNTPYSTNVSAYYTTTPFVSCIYDYVLFSGSSCGAPAGNTATSPNRPNTRFGNCGGTNPNQFTYQWTPNSFLSTNTGTVTTITPTTAPGTVSNLTYSVTVTPTFVPCPLTKTVQITVSNAQTPTIAAIPDVCNTASPFTLSITPSGGTFTTGIASAPINSITGIVTPSLAAIGTNTFMYTVGIGSCIATANGSFNVSQFNTAALTGSVQNLCVTNAPVSLTSIVQSTVNGTWTGQNVTGTYSFNPSGLSTGNYILTYSTTSNPNATLCPDSRTISVAVLNPPAPVISPVPSMCNNNPAIVVNTTPNTGTWTPVAYMNTLTGVFTPSLASVGNNTIMYTTGNPTCLATQVATVYIEAFVPATITGTIPDQCYSNNTTVNLQPYTSVTTGTWSGPGVTGTTFNPNSAATGVVTLSLSTNSQPQGLCPQTSTTAVNVFSVAPPYISPVNRMCNSAMPFQMTVTPVGGLFSSQNSGGINAVGFFNPALGAIGDNIISYTVTSGICKAVSQTTITIEAFVDAKFASYAGPFCKTNPSINLLPLVQNPGGVFTSTSPGFIPGNTFNPQFANIGVDNVIIYQTHSVPTATLCPDTASIRIIVHDIPVVQALNSVNSGCSPLKVNFNTPSANTGTGTWDFGDGTPQQTGLSVTHTYNSQGTYTIAFYYIDDIGCKTQTMVANSVSVFATPIANFDYSPKEITAMSPIVQFTNQTVVLSNNQYNWQMDTLLTTSEINPNVTFPGAGDYHIFLTATSPNGCMSSVDKWITIKNEFGVYIPNSFTPNGDGLNDVFMPILTPFGLDLTVFEMELFDRWGHSIYYTKDYTKGWNGSYNNKGDGIMKEDVYVYKIKYKDATGKLYNKVGHVTLLK
ncbi:MAG: gliding motility-associated C-terminal domain-containing protein [Bacteroidetes bacterium]|nr:gliding motility-associated C-terminal domain-containing protein [Bacteroidota bacterium]